MRHPLAHLGPLAALAALLVPTAAFAGGHTAHALEARAGPYHVVLKVLPAESFSGPHAKMAWDGGAKPVDLTSAARPNRHLVAFITLGGKPVMDGAVTIRYRLVGMHRSSWRSLPVAKMHVAGENLATTHYGNNVRLRPGWYQAVVTVDGHRTPRLSFDVEGPLHPKAMAPKVHKAPGHTRAGSARGW